MTVVGALITIGCLISIWVVYRVYLLMVDFNVLGLEEREP